MRLDIASLEDQPLEGSAGGLPVSDGAPLVLALALEDREVLDRASLVLRRATTAGSSTTVITTDTSANGSTTGVQWIMATWDRSQKVEGLSLAFTSKPNPLSVRVRIARGGGGWFLPPGPHTFILGAAMQLNAVLPDTVAERLLVEFLDPQGAAVAVDLSAASPLSVQLGREPQDLDLRVQGRRPLLRWSGAIPEGSGIVIDDLRSRLEVEIGAEARARTLQLELRAAVAGELDLAWELGSMLIAERFPDGSPTATSSIPWGTAVDVPLLLGGEGPVSIEALALSVAASPVSEQLVGVNTQGTTSSYGQLVRPLYDAARPVQLQQAWSLTGVDVLARALGGVASITLGLHPDSAGRPAAGAVVELSRVIEAPMHEPAWIAFDTAAPLPVTPGVLWVVLRVDEGELVWFTTTSPDSGALVHRRDRGPWLTRPGQTTSLRVRAASAPPKRPLSLRLRGAQADDTAPAWEVPLSLADDGSIRWSAGPDAPSPSSQLSLRITADVATTVELSNLELRYRVGTP